ncbi:MAG: arsenic metallochaperone ArsD family protein [Ignavibacteriales bacterium]|nr:arsenic metallochaperone ArsD family protein [Ignavibacteriales bacterium]
METKPLLVELFTIPQAACDSGKANWIQVGEMVKNQLDTKFGKSIEFMHVEFMSEQWFENQKAQELLEHGEVNFPFVLVDGEIASADKKINVSKINKAIQY